MSAIVLTVHKGESRVDSRVMAGELRNNHRPVMALIDKYLSRFERFGKVIFQKAPSTGSRTGQRERYALLNENQSYFLLSLSRNSDHIVDLKANLVQAFAQARAGEAVAAMEYLPGYHQLHDRVHELAAESENERFVHMNLNKLVNKTVGIGPGRRQTVASSTKSAIVVAQNLAVQAMAAANDHHDGYDAAKKALGKLQVLLLEGAK